MAYQKPLKDRLTQQMLKALRERKMSNAEAADKMGVSETYLSRVVASMQEKERGQTMVAREEAAKLAAVRREHRTRLAKQVKNGELSLEQAAKRANCSCRTMTRYLSAYIEPRRKRKTK